MTVGVYLKRLTILVTLSEVLTFYLEQQYWKISTKISCTVGNLYCCIYRYETYYSH